MSSGLVQSINLKTHIMHLHLTENLILVDGSDFPNVAKHFLKDPPSSDTKVLVFLDDPAVIKTFDDQNKLPGVNHCYGNEDLHHLLVMAITWANEYMSQRTVIRVITGNVLLINSCSTQMKTYRFRRMSVTTPGELITEMGNMVASAKAQTKAKAEELKPVAKETVDNNKVIKTSKKFAKDSAVITPQQFHSFVKVLQDNANEDIFEMLLAKLGAVVRKIGIIETNPQFRRLIEMAQEEGLVVTKGTLGYAAIDINAEAVDAWMVYHAAPNGDKKTPTVNQSQGKEAKNGPQAKNQSQGKEAKNGPVPKEVRNGPAPKEVRNGPAPKSWREVNGPKATPTPALAPEVQPEGDNGDDEKLNALNDEMALGFFYRSLLNDFVEKDLLTPRLAELFDALKVAYPECTRSEFKTLIAIAGETKVITQNDATTASIDVEQLKSIVAFYPQ